MRNAGLRCRICSCALLLPIPFGYSYKGRRLEAMHCRGCGIIFIEPQPSAHELAELYSREYFESDFRCGHEGSYFANPMRDALVNEGFLARLRALVPSGRLLEIGCAGGAFLNLARQAGFDVHGVEFSRDAAQFARDTFGVEVFAGELSDAAFSSASFNLVYMGDVIEHVPDPVATLREIRRILVPRGVLAMACPSQTNTLFSRAGFTVYRMLGRRATVHLPPYHLFEYRPASMRWLLDHCGFAEIHISQGIIPPGAINVRGSLAERLGKKLFHYPNYFLTRSFGIYGDRMEVIARTSNE